TAALGTILALGLLTACGDAGADSAADPGGGVDRGAVTSAAPTPESTPSPTRSGSRAPTSQAVPAVLQFTGTQVGGAPFDGASLAGKPAVVWFWAPWCPVCKSQIPQVQAAAAAYAGEAGVIGIGSLDDGDAIAGFAGEASGVTMLQDPDGELWRHFGITEQSTFVVLDAAGREVARTSYGEGLDLDALLADLT
ncbi:MAG: redoxin family protein, partial [Nocardioides sp.]